MAPLNRGAISYFGEESNVKAERIQAMINATEDELTLVIQKGQSLSQEIIQKQQQVQDLTNRHTALASRKQTLEEVLKFAE